MSHEQDLLAVKNEITVLVQQFGNQIVQDAIFELIDEAVLDIDLSDDPDICNDDDDDDDEKKD